MSVPNELLDAVVAIGIIEPMPNGELDLGRCATAFLVSRPLEKMPNRIWIYLVTAWHVVKAIQDEAGNEHDIGIRVNTRGGGAKVVRLEGVEWIFHPAHPDDEYVDLAIAPISFPGEAWAVRTIGTELFVDNHTSECAFGPGDEIFMAGMFSYHIGEKRNSPIVRTGNLAMVPCDKVRVRLGSISAYLIEARSTGGMSGSPVFILPSFAIAGSNPPVCARGTQFFFLGLVHGHFDSDRTESEDQGPDDGNLNVGIAIVTPGRALLETLAHPELVSLCEKREAEMLATQSGQGQAAQPPCVPSRSRS